MGQVADKVNKVFKELQVFLDLLVWQLLKEKEATLDPGENLEDWACQETEGHLDPRAPRGCLANLAHKEDPVLKGT
jgi:hypothetical protein